MPNWETDDNSTDGDDDGGYSLPRQTTIDTCSNCFAEIDTTGDPAPECPCCGSKHWFHVRNLSDICPYAHRDCAGPKGSVAVHVCRACLDLVAMHERVPRAALHCMCGYCDPSGVFARGFNSNSQNPKPPAPAAPKPKNPFDDDIDDWL